MMLPYKAVFNRQAWEFAVRAKDNELTEIGRWMDRIELAPATHGDYPEQDDDGRELQVVVLSAVVITCWTDDAVREVRVVRIESLGGSICRQTRRGPGPQYYCPDPFHLAHEAGPAF